MTQTNHGRAFVFGDGIDTDVLAPGLYMKYPIATIAQHCLESIDPDFVKNVRTGDVVVAGMGFGIGSSREQAPEALKHRGVAAVLARSFGGIFYRNALNLGLPVLVCDAVDGIGAGDLVHVDAATGVIDNQTRGTRLSAKPLPPFLLAMIHDGGLVPHLEKRFAQGRVTGSSGIQDRLGSTIPIP
jgi:3-isopropylmalate/(R)-2-methylmalate dehydratase small subunit